MEQLSILFRTVYTQPIKTGNLFDHSVISNLFSNLRLVFLSSFYIFSMKIRLICSNCKHFFVLNYNIQHPIHFDSCYFTLSTSNNRATPSFIDVLRSNNLREWDSFVQIIFILKSNEILQYIFLTFQANNINIFLLLKINI